MKQYFKNIGLWIVGFFKLGKLRYKEGWNAWKFFPVYLLDVGFCVLVAAGPVATHSWFMNHHRDGWLNDKVLDLIEKVDEDHGEAAGPPLWGSKEPPQDVRIFVTSVWVAIALGLITYATR
jgi:hypothetical protein